MANYYNTNNEDRTLLSESRERALKQQAKIKDFFYANSDKSFTPEEVWKELFDIDTPLTSVRRAITNLTSAGGLIKTPEMRFGSYGKKVHTWRALIDNRQGVLAI